MIGAVLLTHSALSAAVPPVDRSYCHVGKWDKAPLNVPLRTSRPTYGGMVDGPISGNGDFGLVVD